MITPLKPPDLVWPGSGVPRTLGQVHMSELRDAAMPKKHKEQPAPDDGLGPVWNLDLCAEIGFMLEDALEASLKSRMGQVAEAGKAPSLEGAERPGEIELDGVLASPDLVHWGNEILHEIKFRWAKMPDSVEELEAKHQPVLYQIKTYLHILNTVFGGEWKCVLWVLWARGDYFKRPGPVLRPYLIEYSKAELEKFWEVWVVRERDKLLKGEKNAG